MTIIPRRPPPEAAKPTLPSRVGHAAAGVAKGLLASAALAHGYLGGAQ